MPRAITPALLDAMFQGFRLDFQNAFNGVTPTWNRVAMEVPSTAASENYGWLGQMPRIREWIGDRQYKSLDSFGYQIRNRTFESTVSIPREQIEDDSWGVFKPVVQEMGRSVGAFPDELTWPMLTAGFSSLCFDGQYFFDTDHPVKDAAGVEQSVSNMQAGASAPWFLLDTTRAVKPLVFQKRRAFDFIAKTDPKTSDRVFASNEFVYGTDGRCNAGYGLWQLAFGSKAALNSANFRAARQAMLSLKGDYGRPLGVTPNLLVVGPSNEGVARDLVFAEKLANGASNTDYKIVDLLVVPWLA